MVSVIVTSAFEKNSIGRAINAIYESIKAGKIARFEIIQVSPDRDTLDAGKETALQLGIIENFKQIEDPSKGKAFALNLALKEAAGEIVVMTDGDVEVDRNAVENLLRPFADKNISGVTGRPTPKNSRNTFMGYLSHLLTSAADHKRKDVFIHEIEGYHKCDGACFPMSGYLLAFRNNGLQYDSGYIDDTYITLEIVRNGGNLAYAPNAKVHVIYPNSVRDYLIQRVRNISGNKEIYKQDAYRKYKDERSLFEELKYIFYPLTFAQTPKEFLYSTLLYPLRALTWVYATYHSLKPKERYKRWERVESTKG